MHGLIDSPNGIFFASIKYLGLYEAVKTRLKQLATDFFSTELRDKEEFRRIGLALLLVAESKRKNRKKNS
jgi:hypothetical protein